MCWYAGRGLDVQANKAAHLSVCPCTCLASSPTETVGAHQRLSASLSRLTWIYQTPLVSVQQRRPVLPSPAAVLDGSRGGCRAISGHIAGPFGSIGGMRVCARATDYALYQRSAAILCPFSCWFLPLWPTAQSNDDVILFCPYIYKNMVVRMWSCCANHWVFISGIVHARHARLKGPSLKI